MTENNKVRPSDLTEEKVKEAWQIVLNAISLFSTEDDKCTVENAEFVEES